MRCDKSVKTQAPSRLLFAIGATPSATGARPAARQSYWLEPPEQLSQSQLSSQTNPLASQASASIFGSNAIGYSQMPQSLSQRNSSRPFRFRGSTSFAARSPSVAGGATFLTFAAAQVASNRSAVETGVADKSAMFAARAIRVKTARRLGELRQKEARWARSMSTWYPALVLNSTFQLYSIIVNLLS